MSISEEKQMEDCRNMTVLFQDTTSVDMLLGKWLKDEVEVKPNSGSDEMMDMETNTNEENKKHSIAPSSSDNTIGMVSKEDIPVCLLDIWKQCNFCHDRYKASSYREKMKEKNIHSEARKIFDEWIDVFLGRALTASNEEWDAFMKRTSEDGLFVYDDLRRRFVECLVTELRTLCLHFDAYKDSGPLYDYVFGRGWRILRLLCRIEFFVFEQSKEERKNGFGTTFAKAQAKTQVLSSDNIAEDEKEFVDLLLHLFQVDNYYKNNYCNYIKFGIKSF